MSLPLLYRLPNPDGPLVGRASELAQLVEVISSPGATAGVVGVHGLGKSHLALEAVRAWCEGGAYLAATGDEDLQGLLRALRASLGVRGRSEEPLGELLDLADARLTVLVVDDAHRLTGADRRIVEAAQRYSRRARWLFVGHELPVTAARLVSLGPMRPVELAALAAQRAPDATDDERARAVRRAQGSPMRLLRALRGLGEGADGAGLGEREQRAISLLAHLRRPVRSSALPGSLASPLAALEARGWARRRGAFLALHPEAAALSPLAPASTDDFAELAGALAGGNVGERLEAIRLWLRAGREPDALAILERVGDTMLADGYGRDLVEALGPPGEWSEELQPWGLRALVEAGDPAMAKGARPPRRGASVTASFAWLRLRAALEDHAGVRELAEGVFTDERARSEDRADVCLFASAACLLEGEHAAAGRWLSQMRPTDARQEAHRDAVLAILAGQRGDEPEALRCIEAAKARLGEVAPERRAQVIYNLGIALYGMQRPLEASALFEQWFPEDDLTTGAVVGRRALELDTHLALLAGNLERAERRLPRIRRFASAHGPIIGRATLMEATILALRGELGPAREKLSLGVSIATEYGGVEDLAYGSQWQAIVAWREDRAPEPSPPAEGSVSAQTAADWRAIAAASYDRSASAPCEHEATYPEHAHLRALREALCAGTPHRVGEAPASLPVPFRAMAEVLRVEIQIAHGGSVDLEAAKRPVDRVGSPELRAELSLLERALHEDLEAVLALAGAPSLVGRMAARLVGGSPEHFPLGDLRERMVAALGSAAGWTTGRGTLPRGGWVIDRVGGRVGQLGSARVEVIKPGSVQLAALVALAGAGREGLDKEALTARVWGGEEYHPLRHDNRLRLVITKLRRRVPEPPALATLDDGYALRAPVQVLEHRTLGSRRGPESGMGRP